MPHSELRKRLSLDRICFLCGSDKSAALDELVSVLVSSGEIDAGDEVQRGLDEREASFSTGIGLGVAIPHAGHPRIRRLTLAVGIHAEGLADYETLDHQPVHFIFLIASGPRHHRAYVRLLGELARALRNDHVRGDLLTASTPAEAYSALLGAAEFIV